jgi:hypothetical protein
MLFIISVFSYTFVIKSMSPGVAVRKEPSHFRIATFLFLSVANAKNRTAPNAASPVTSGVVVNKHSPLMPRSFTTIFEIRRNFTRYCV